MPNVLTVLRVQMRATSANAECTDGAMNRTSFRMVQTVDDDDSGDESEDDDNRTVKSKQS